MLRLSKLHAGLLAALVVLAMDGLATAGEEAEYAKLLSDASPALVTVKFVLKLEGQFGKREGEVEITGLMIDPSGMVLCANSKLGMPRMRGIGSATPTNIKVLIGEDTEGMEAKVLARDTELDLAWVKIKEPGNRKFKSLDLQQSALVKPGDRLLTIRRMAKFFDRAPTISEGRMAGRTSKPRDLLIPGGGIDVEPGQAIFNPQGKFVGVVVLQLPDMEELESNPMAFMGMRSDLMNGLILPTSEIVKATARAKESKEEDADDARAAAGKKSESDASKKKADKSDVHDGNHAKADKGKEKKKKGGEDDDDGDE